MPTPPGIVFPDGMVEVNSYTADHFLMLSEEATDPVVISAVNFLSGVYTAIAALNSTINGLSLAVSSLTTRVSALENSPNSQIFVIEEDITQADIIDYQYALAHGKNTYKVSVTVYDNNAVVQNVSDLVHVTSANYLYIDFNNEIEGTWKLIFVFYLG